MSGTSDFQLFMSRFVNEHLSKPKEETVPPFRLVEDKILQEEVHGHCCEWAAQYLYAQ